MELNLTERRAFSDSELRAHIARLLERYPQTSPEEEAQILRFLKKGPTVEVAMLLSDPDAKPAIERFTRDHKRHFSIGPFGIAAAMAAVVLLIVLCMMLWDAGLTR